jgi:hypothetical protein
MLVTRKKSCCGNCRGGKPCCGKAKRPPRPAFVKKGGLWLPRREITAPKALLQHPSEHEWSGFWKPWKPLLYPTFDLSCMPCCSGECCEPFDCPLPYLSVAVSGDACGSGGEPFILTPYNPGDCENSFGDVRCASFGGWRNLDIIHLPAAPGCLQIAFEGFWLCCDAAFGGCNGFKLSIINNLASGCGWLATPYRPTSCTCDPWSFVFTTTIIDIDDLGDCLCCDVGATIIFTITVAF